MPSPRSKKLKPKKPYPTFPLTPHANGQWCKKILGKVHFFGVWADPRTARDEYNRQAADLHAGRTAPPKNSDKPTAKDIVNTYLSAQKTKVEHGLITARWFDDCLRTMKDFASFVGIRRTCRPDTVHRNTCGVRLNPIQAVTQCLHQNGHGVSDRAPACGHQGCRAEFVLGFSNPRRYRPSRLRMGARNRYLVATILEAG